MRDECCQDEQLFRLKLWQINNWVNLKQVKDNCPYFDWEQIFQRIWMPYSLAAVLKQLCENPEAVETLPLNPILGAPEGHIHEGRHRPIINPRLCITIVPRRVKRETGIQGDVIKHRGRLGTHRFELDFNPNSKYKAAITAGKILVLIRTTEEPDIHRSDSESVCQGYMGAQVRMMKKNKPNEGVTRHLDHEE